MTSSKGPLISAVGGRWFGIRSRVPSSSGSVCTCVFSEDPQASLRGPSKCTSRCPLVMRIRFNRKPKPLVRSPRNNRPLDRVLFDVLGYFNIFSVLVPVTAFLLVILLIYGYVKIPKAQTAFYSLLTSAGELVKRDNKNEGTTQQALGIEHFLSRPKIWLDSLDLHVYGLGLWAGTMPFLGTHVTCTKKVVSLTCVALLGLYSLIPHLLLVTLAPYIDGSYDGGILGSEVGVKPGMAYLFVSIPHTFSKYNLSHFMAFLLYLTFFLINLQHLSLHVLMIWENASSAIPRTVIAFFRRTSLLKYNLSHFMAFLLYLTFVLINLQHLSLHVLMIWENASSAIPRTVIAFFRRTSLLSAMFILISFLLTLPYLSECGIYLYQIIRFYVDRLMFSLIIFCMVPCVIGFIRQESLRTPVDRVFMGVWYGLASVMAACLLIYNFVVFVYPESVVAYEQRWAENLGWCVSIAPLLLGVTLGALHTLFSLKGSLCQRLVNSLKTGSLPSTDGTLPGDNTPSNATGDTDVKSPCLARQNVSRPATYDTTSPHTQARAPLLQAQAASSPELSGQTGLRKTVKPGQVPTNEGPKIHRRRLRASEVSQSKGSNKQTRTPSKRHSEEVTSRRERTGNTSPRQRMSASAALGRENSGFGEEELLNSTTTGPEGNNPTFQGDCCASGACSCGGGLSVKDGDSCAAGSIPAGYGTLQTPGPPKATVEVILKSASDGNMVRL
ncbi:transporter [Plakobranchus ocellatus]|uniref:Transporter n=1 Tax=Plakobranchus ocellatus TaxID=259542 RepID=A0AAV4AXP3_9GAST|nr:transporter [Plakobranchus ocellatus]